MMIKIANEEKQIPPEILDRTFSHLERVSNFDGDNIRMNWDVWNRDTEFRPQSSLHPLLFVSKEWYDIAQRRLYHSVGIGGAFIDTGGNVFRKFYRTIKGKPHLASLVRELRLQNPHSEYNPARAHDESLDYVQVFRHCKNVESVSISISEWSLAFSDELKDALGRLDLVELFVASGPNAERSLVFHSPSDVVVYLPKWPRLERLFADTVFQDFDVTILPDPSTLRGRCPALREINIPADRLDANQLLSLSEMAPNVERFGACIDSDTDATGALGACLRTWSSSLRHLSLESDTTNVAFAWPYLHELRSLFVFSTIVPPDALLNFEHLEFLVYYCAVEDLERLANILTEGEKPWLPSLRDLYLTPDGKWDVNTDVDRSIISCTAIRRACTDRKISFEEDFSSS